MANKYNPSAKCPKCGHEVVFTSYQKQRSYTCLSGCSDGEHLHRTCQRCQYQWPEAVLELERLDA